LVVCVAFLCGMLLLSFFVNYLDEAYETISVGYSEEVDYGVDNDIESPESGQPVISGDCGAVCRAIDRGLDFLHVSQLDYGEFVSYMCSASEECGLDSSPFATALVLQAIEGIDDQRVTEMRGLGLDFLLSEEEEGLWRYWSSRNPKNHLIPPDLDDTSVVSRLLKASGMAFEDNIGRIMDNKDEEGLFLTWVSDGDNDVDCVVNANVLAYLGYSDPKVCAYVNAAIEEGIDCSHYYLSDSALFYMVSRAFREGVDCFRESGGIISESLYAIQRPDGSFGSDLETALSANALMNFGHHGEKLDLAIEWLLGKQGKDGSWNAEFFYKGPRDCEDCSYWKSKELSTAIALEALWTYLKISA